MPDHFLVINPLPERLTGQDGHVIFKRSPGLSPISAPIQYQEDVKLNELPASEFCEVSKQIFSHLITTLVIWYRCAFFLEYDKQGENRSKPIIAANEDETTKSSSRLEILTLELALFLDAQLWSYFVDEFGEKRAEQEVVDFSLALINNVYLLYQESSMVPKLDIILVRFELWKTQPVLNTYVPKTFTGEYLHMFDVEGALESKQHKSGEAQLFLDAFCTYQTKLNVGTDADATHWDHATLLTG